MNWLQAQSHPIRRTALTEGAIHVAELTSVVPKRPERLVDQQAGAPGRETNTGYNAGTRHRCLSA
jgi:hypothetical protein